MALTDKLTAIANAIRAKTGKTANMTLAEMPAEIASIQTGITPTGSITLTDENTYDVTEKAQAVVDMSATRAALAEAVTAKGVDTLPDSSFDTIATNIGLIEGGGGLPNVRKFTVNTDPTLGTIGGITFPVITNGRALYLVTYSTDSSHWNSTSRYPRAVLIGIENGVGSNAPLYVRYDNAYTQLTGASYSGGTATILGTTACRFTDNYTLDVYEFTLL